MKVVKDYIKQKLIDVGFKSQNLFDYEQLDNSQLKKNLDSAEFFGGQGTLEKRVSGQLSGISTTGTQAVTQTQVMERSFTQQMRLLMKKETLEDRLRGFYEALYTSNSPVDGIIRLEEQDPNTQIITYYDILDIAEQIGKEIKLGAVEVILTYKIRTGLSQRQQITTVNNFPVTASF